MNEKTFFIIAFTSLVLVGCQSQSNQSSALTSNSVNTQTDFQTQQVVSLADQANYDAAFSLANISYCDKIEQEILSEQCKIEFNDSVQLEKALIQKNQAFCEELSTEDKKEACKIRLEVMAKEAQTQETQKKELEEDQKAMAKLLVNKDFASCKNLKLESSRYDCEMNILSNESLQKKDPTWCDKASIKEVQNNCHTLYQANYPTH